MAKTVLRKQRTAPRSSIRERLFIGKVLIFITFLFVDLFLYNGLWKTFFQQDEWSLFGRAIYELQSLPFSIFSFSGTHLHPLGSLVWLLEYKVFGFNSVYYAGLSFFLHALIATTVYVFLRSITKSTVASFILSLMFLISFPARQPVVWFAATHTYFLTIFFVLLFFIYLINHMQLQIISIKNILVLLTLFLAALLFREEGMLIIPLFTVYVLLFWDWKKIKANKRKLLFFLGFMVFCVVLRVTLQVTSGEHIQYEQDSNKVMTFYNILTSPLKLIIQSLVDYDQLVFFAQKYTRLAYPRYLSDGLVIITTVFENVVFLLSIPILLLTGISFFFLKRYDKRVLVFALVFIVSYAFLLAPQTRRLTQEESRYITVASIGVLLIAYEVFKAFFSVRNVYIKGAAIVFAGVSIIVFSVYSYTHVRNVMTQNYIPTSQKRISILSQIRTLHPTISRNTVFYITCKFQKDCITYPLVLPFQSGVGQMLLVLYGSKNEPAYAPFLDKFYLWDWEAQGYRKIDGYGFGYFRQEKELLKALKKREFTTKDLIALRYNNSTNKIEDVSKSVRKRLSNSL